MAQFQAQRVGVFVDVQNMYYSARNLYQQKVNFGEILKEAVKGRQLIQATAYVIRADVGEEESFYEALRKIGFDIRAKDLQVYAGGAKKGDWDIGLAMDALRFSSKIDVAVLVSGDGDFFELARYLKEAHGLRVEVIAFGQTVSGKLTEEADQFTDLGKATSRFLIANSK